MFRRPGDYGNCDQRANSIKHNLRCVELRIPIRLDQSLYFLSDHVLWSWKNELYPGPQPTL